MTVSVQPKFSFVSASGVRLHVAEAGPPNGPLLVLLHGFPEFWYGWRHQIAPLAEAGYHVVVPDQRGYNLSSKPQEIAAYRLDALAGDVVGLADHFGAERFFLAGHDWGAIVAWWVAQTHPARLLKAVALSAGHPAAWKWRFTHDRTQRRLSRYVRTMQWPWLPEWAMRRRNYAALAEAVSGTAVKGAVTGDDLAMYRKAWSQPGALTGSLNWYRAIWREDLRPPSSYRVKAPMLMVWGGHDAYGTRDLAEESVGLCADGRLATFDNATHWVLTDEAERVVRTMRDFFEG